MAKLLGANNTKARTLVILVFGFILIGLLFVYRSFTNDKDSTKNQASVATRIPGNLTPIPGGNTSAKYLQLQEEDNKRRAENAKATGTSATATIIRNRR